jgi:glycosyltransferase involved in cell wall biosynthesis
MAGWVTDLYIVDSGSTDATLAIADELGAKVVSHKFETHTRQWRWALATLPLRTEWVLALDADQRLTPELADAIASAFGEGGSSGETDGFFLNRRQVFRGRWIKYGGYYPKYLLKLFRRSAVALHDSDLVDHHFHVSGRTRQLRGDLIEDNRNEAQIFDWIQKHNRYARLQATQELQQLNAGAAPRLFGSPDERTAWMKSVWSRLPLYLRPFAYFVYRYILRLGFLDGKEGFIFHFMQAYWYRLLIDINRDEQSRAAQPRADAVAHGNDSGDHFTAPSDADAMANPEPERLRN